MKNILIDSLASLADEFSRNELAYLALTTKIEMPIRDRWAFSLHRRLVSAGYSVAREWNQVDLAILQNDCPLALIKLKSMYAFDAACSAEHCGIYCDRLREDVTKASSSYSGAADVFTVLLATNPAEVPSACEEVVKYAGYVNSALSRFGTAEAVRDAAISAAARELADENVVYSAELHGGEAFGIETNVLCWLMAPGEQLPLALAA